MHDSICEGTDKTCNNNNTITLIYALKHFSYRKCITMMVKNGCSRTYFSKKKIK